MPGIARTIILLLAFSIVSDLSADQAGDYLIGPGDVLEIMVWKEPDLSRTVSVRLDGKISPLPR